MMQHARLDSACGVWHLVTESDVGPVRFGEDKDTAPADLAEEGWVLGGPFPRRYRQRWRFDRTFSLVRLTQ